MRRWLLFLDLAALAIWLTNKLTPHLFTAPGMCISPTKQTAAEATHQHHNAQCAARATAQRQAHYAANPDFDPALTKPVRIVAPPKGLRPAERQQMKSELGCLRREAAATARGIAHLEKQLAA